MVRIFHHTKIRPRFIPYTGGQYQAHYTPPTLPKGTAFILKISPFRKSKKILSAATLAEAIRGCDTYAQNKIVPGNVGLGYVTEVPAGL